ncbi:phospholipase-like protein [Tanacetum coccineum]
MIPRVVALSNGLKFEKSSYDRLFYSENSSFNKLTPSAIKMNELWVVDKKDVHVRAVDKEDTGNQSENVPVCGLDQQSMEGASQCMNVDEPYKNEEARDDPEFKVKENEEASHFDDPEFKVNENEEASHSYGFLSTQQVRELINDVFDMSSLGPNSVQDDACVSELMDADQPSLVKNDLDDVHIDSVVKDAEESEYPRQKFPVGLDLFSQVYASLCSAIHLRVNTNDVSALPFSWNSWGPRKVNVCAWHVALDRLPTRLNLCQRGINLPTSMKRSLRLIVRTYFRRYKYYLCCGLQIVPPNIALLGVIGLELSEK